MKETISKAQLAEEIRRLAQFDADAAGEGFTIRPVSVTPLREQSPEGVHWSVDFVTQPGRGYVEAAARKVASQGFDIAPD